MSTRIRMETLYNHTIVQNIKHYLIICIILIQIIKKGHDSIHITFKNRQNSLGFRHQMRLLGVGVNTELLEEDLWETGIVVFCLFQIVFSTLRKLTRLQTFDMHTFLNIYVRKNLLFS